MLNNSTCYLYENILKDFEKASFLSQILRMFNVWFCWKRLRAYTNDRLCINYACITFLLYCASDFSVIF